MWSRVLSYHAGSRNLSFDSLDISVLTFNNFWLFLAENRDLDIFKQSRKLTTFCFNNLMRALQIVKGESVRQYVTISIKLWRFWISQKSSWLIRNLRQEEEEQSDTEYAPAAAPPPFFPHGEYFLLPAPITLYNNVFSGILRGCTLFIHSLGFPLFY